MTELHPSITPELEAAIRASDLTDLQKEQALTLGHYDVGQMDGRSMIRDVWPIDFGDGETRVIGPYIGGGQIQDMPDPYKGLRGASLVKRPPGVAMPKPAAGAVGLLVGRLHPDQAAELLRLATEWNDSTVDLAVKAAFGTEQEAAQRRQARQIAHEAFVAFVAAVTH